MFWFFCIQFSEHLASKTQEVYHIIMKTLRPILALITGGYTLVFGSFLILGISNTARDFAARGLPPLTLTTLGLACIGITALFLAGKEKHAYILCACVLGVYLTLT